MSWMHALTFAPVVIIAPIAAYAIWYDYRYGPKDPPRKCPCCGGTGRELDSAH